MYTVMLLDDEPWALESLSRVFPWEQNGFAVTGRFTDPVAGWDAVSAEQPDVVFIDIRMPVMSGLEMAARAQELPQPPLFVVVSGYGSFEYAQRALRLGVFDYCLKPVERGDAQALLVKIRAELERRDTRKSAALLEAIQSGMSAEELFLQAGRSMEGEWWRVAVLRFVDGAAAEELAPTLRGLNARLVWLGATKAMVVANGDERVGEALERAMDSLSGHERLFIGLSRVSRHAHHLACRVSEALSCAYTDFVNPHVRKVVYHARESPAVEARVSALIDAVRHKDLTLWDAQIGDYAGMMAREGVQMHSICRYWNRLMDAFNEEGGERLRGELEWVMDPEGMRAFLGGPEEMASYLDTLMRDIVERNVSQGANRSFSEMMEYVRAHYTERMRLSDLAARFHLNTAYCSEVFRKSAGETFTDFVTRLRMEHAQRAILAGECNLQALALELGYGDYFTFSKRFKQYFGQSPSHMTGTKKS